MVRGHGSSARPGNQILLHSKNRAAGRGGGIYYVDMALNITWTLKMPLVYLASWRWILNMNFYAWYQFLSHFDVFFAYKSEFLFKGPDIPKHFCTHLMYGIKPTLYILRFPSTWFCCVINMNFRALSLLPT